MTETTTAPTTEPEESTPPLVLWSVDLGDPGPVHVHDAVEIVAHLARYGIEMPDLGTPKDQQTPGHGVTITPDHRALLFSAVDPGPALAEYRALHERRRNDEAGGFARHELDLPPLPEGATEHNAAAIHAHLVSRGVELYDGVSINAEGKAVVVAKAPVSSGRRRASWSPQAVLKDYEHTPPRLPHQEILDRIESSEMPPELKQLMTDVLDATVTRRRG